MDYVDKWFVKNMVFKTLQAFGSSGSSEMAFDFRMGRELMDGVGGVYV